MAIKDTGRDKYDRLYKEKKWLGDNNSVHTVGGRALDIHQIPRSIAAAIKDWYPMNEVPPQIVEKIKQVQQKVEDAESEIDELIGMVSNHVMYGKIL